MLGEGVRPGGRPGAIGLYQSVMWMACMMRKNLTQRSGCGLRRQQPVHGQPPLGSAEACSPWTASIFRRRTWQEIG